MAIKRWYDQFNFDTDSLAHASSHICDSPYDPNTYEFRDSESIRPIEIIKIKKLAK